MDFRHTDTRQMLADTLQRYLAQNFSLKSLHELSSKDSVWPAKLWSDLSSLGIVAALFEEGDGGLGGTGFDIAAVFEPLGKSLAASPFHSILIAGRMLSRSGNFGDLVSSIIAGDAVVVAAHQECTHRVHSAKLSTTANQSSDGWLLTGAKVVVDNVEGASQVIVSAQASNCAPGTDSIALFLVDSNAKGVSIKGYPVIDGGRAGDIAFNESPAILIAKEASAIVEEAQAAGTVALCWEAVGIMEIMKISTLDYLRTRRQFGMSIGKFQALQHRMANIAIEIEQARSSAINAAVALSFDRSRRERTASAAKFTVGRVGALVAEECIQLHGGIGMTWELPLPHYAKRLTMINSQLGDEDYHLERYMRFSDASYSDFSSSLLPGEHNV